MLGHTYSLAAAENLKKRKKKEKKSSRSGEEKKTGTESSKNDFAKKGAERGK